MTLPASGAISFNDVNVELGHSGTTTLTMNDSDIRKLFGRPDSSTSIAMNQGYSKYNSEAFSLNSGNNNVTLTLTPRNTAIGTVLSDGGILAKCSQVAADIGGWKFYWPDDIPGSTLSTMVAGQLYIITMTSSGTFTNYLT